jgi:hypothetical protein
MKHLTASLALTAILAWALPVRAETPVVVELFTSQGCSSCPPADALLLDLAARDDVLALAFHVDYWDGLGWPDRFAAPWATARQRSYAALLGDGGRVYTPQMIIDGRRDVIGSRRSAVVEAIGDSRRAAAARPAIGVTRGDDGTLTLALPQVAAGGQVLVLAYLPRGETEVRRGENSGHRLIEGQIVRRIADLGWWDGAAASRRLPSGLVPSGHGVAVLVQDGRTGTLRAVGHLSPAGE